jgi:hypothetical protein
MGVATVIVMPLASSAGVLLIKAIQMFDYLTFVNIEKPSNLISFLSIFDNNILNLTPNFFEKEGLDDEDDPDESSEDSERRILLSEESESNDGSQKCQSHALISENDMSCYFLNSVGDLLLHSSSTSSPRWC